MNRMIILIGWFILLIATSVYAQEIPAKTETKYLIAYNVFVPDSTEKNYEVYVINPEGGHPKNITNHPDVAWTYLAIKDKILFISDRDTCYRCFYLYQMNHDGSEVQRITDFKLRDSWMGVRNNGQELIVNPAEDSVFYIIGRKGSLLRKVPVGLAYFNDPCFSPDGSSIVFRGAKQKFKKDNGFIDELYIMNSDGSGLQKLTTYPVGDTTAKWFNYHTGPPRFHPSGEFISYQSKQGGKSSLFAITPDGKKQWKLTNIPDNEGWHEWSPDGNWLAIETYDLEQKQFHITLMNWKTKETKQLTGNSYRFQQAPVFVEKK
jgi:TolB protein